MTTKLSQPPQTDSLEAKILRGVLQTYVYPKNITVELSHDGKPSAQPNSIHVFDSSALIAAVKRCRPRASTLDFSPLSTTTHFPQQTLDVNGNDYPSRYYIDTTGPISYARPSSIRAQQPDLPSRKNLHSRFDEAYQNLLFASDAVQPSAIIGSGSIIGQNRQSDNAPYQLSSQYDHHHQRHQYYPHQYPPFHYTSQYQQQDSNSNNGSAQLSARSLRHSSSGPALSSVESRGTSTEETDVVANRRRSFVKTENVGVTAFIAPRVSSSARFPRIVDSDSTVLELSKHRLLLEQLERHLMNIEAKIACGSGRKTPDHTVSFEQRICDDIAAIRSHFALRHLDPRLAHCLETNLERAVHELEGNKLAHMKEVNELRAELTRATARINAIEHEKAHLQQSLEHSSHHQHHHRHSHHQPHHQSISPPQAKSSSAVFVSESEDHHCQDEEDVRGLKDKLHLLTVERDNLLKEVQIVHSHLQDLKILALSDLHSESLVSKSNSVCSSRLSGVSPTNQLRHDAEKYRKQKSLCRKLAVELERAQNTIEMLHAREELQNSELSALQEDLKTAASRTFTSESSGQVEHEEQNATSANTNVHALICESLKLLEECAFTADCLFHIQTDYAAKKEPKLTHIVGGRHVSMSEKTPEKPELMSDAEVAEKLCGEMRQLRETLARTHKLVRDVHAQSVADGLAGCPI